MPTPARILEDYLNAFPDLERVAEFLHEDVEFQLLAPGGQPRKGRDRIIGGLTREFQKFYRKESFGLRVLMVFGDDIHAGARFRIEAETRLGPYENDYAVIVRVKDGKIICGWEYTDTMAAANQIGKAWAAKTAPPLS